MNAQQGASTTSVTAFIDLDALKHNLHRVRQIGGGRKVIAVIKANAYGHGIVTVAQTLQSAGVDAFAVARLDEAKQLRQQNITVPILCLEGFVTQQELLQLVELGVQPVVHQLSQIELLEQTSLPGNSDVWLKVDTGMHRMGIPPELFDDAWRRLNSLDSVDRVRVMTHLASADEVDSPQTKQQLALFEDCIQGVDTEFSIANSAGVLQWPETHADWLRPGVMLFGVSPFVGHHGTDLDLKSVMTLKSRVVAINHFKKGDTIGYGATWACPEDMPVGVVACGYGDGYPRHAVSGTPVLVAGQRCSLVGRVSMDSICVDLRNADVGVGDEVVLWGQGLPVEKVALSATTIPYELLCNVSVRVKCVTEENTHTP